MAGSGWERRVLPVCVGAALVGALALEVIAVLLLRQRGGAGERGSEARRTEAFPFASLASLLFLLGNVLENARRFVTASPSTRGVMLAGAGQGWDYCYSCQSHVPPRCSHCFSCNICILRRDHHCTLLGQCLGYQNYRYFLCLLLHGSVALLYGCVINADVVLSLLQEGTSVQAMLLLLLPWLMLLMACWPCVGRRPMNGSKEIVSTTWAGKTTFGKCWGIRGTWCGSCLSLLPLCRGTGSPSELSAPHLSHSPNPVTSKGFHSVFCKGSRGPCEGRTISYTSALLQSR
nr:probable palmitoyltransferase ZDHHC24 isoform X2 [Zootoca vivipara]